MYRLERRPGIEIIPISSQPTQSLKSSITITPINSTSKNSSSAGASGEKRTGANNGNEHSSSSSSSSSKRSDGLSSSDSGRLKLEKKKKRKREDSPMGPPEKMPGMRSPLYVINRSLVMESIKNSNKRIEKQLKCPRVIINSALKKTE